MLKRWLMAGAIMSILPFSLLACDDDDDDPLDSAGSVGDQVRETAGAAQDTVADAANEARSAVSGITPVRVTLEEREGSGVSGTAIVTPEGSNRVRVTFEVDLQGYRPPVDRDDDDDDDLHDDIEAGIWEGTCDDMSGEPAYDLDDLDDDEIHTETASIGLQELKDGDYVIALVGDDFDDDDDDDDDIDDDRLLACGAIE